MAIRTPQGTLVLPADFAVVKPRSFKTAPVIDQLIIIGELLNGDGFRLWKHAIFYAGGPQDLILEAEAGGAQLRPFHYDPADVLWSSDNPDLNLTQGQRGHAMEIAQHYKGIGYSFLDYDALAAHRLHIPAPGLQAYIASTGHMICSQLVDQCRLDLGSHLFADGRWPGYVTPAAEGNLILSSSRKLKYPGGRNES